MSPETIPDATLEGLTQTIIEVGFRRWVFEVLTKVFIYLDLDCLAHSPTISSPDLWPGERREHFWEFWDFSVTGGGNGRQ